MKWRNAALMGVFNLALSLGVRAENQPPAEAQVRATRADNIHSVRLSARQCAPQIGEALTRSGINLVDPGQNVDVVLEVTITRRAGWLVNTPLIGTYLGGIATRATYEASIIGKGNQVLLSLHGEERAITGREMCQDIGDYLAERLTRSDDEDD